jgi:hypothetical protein
MKRAPFIFEVGQVWRAPGGMDRLILNLWPASLVAEARVQTSHDGVTQICSLRSFRSWVSQSKAHLVDVVSNERLK